MSLGNWLNERAGIVDYWKAKKALPIPAHLSFFRCFGGISLSIILLQLATGIFMLFFYENRPQEAYNSIIAMSNDVPFGGLIRNIHRWGATLLIATIITHMANVFYQRAFRRPREFNWLSGLTMLIIVFLFSISGSILPWNWRSYWLLTMIVDYVETWPVIGNLFKWFLVDFFTLTRSFAIHIWILPLISVFMLAFHFRMVKRHGIAGPL